MFLFAVQLLKLIINEFAFFEKKTDSLKMRGTLVFYVLSKNMI